MPVKQLLTPKDFAECPVWRYDEDQEGYFEVRGEEDLSGDVGDLEILATFTTPTGLQLTGEIIGVRDIFAIGLFVNDEIVLINRNMQSRSREQVAKFLTLSGLSDKLSFETLFPLRFKTRWGDETFVDFEGVFTKPD
jgi:hypothetical protein